jgi:sugar phosphate isomerase/epimerase
MNIQNRLSLNQATIKYAALDDAITATVAAGIPAIGLWREPVQAVGLADAARLVSDSGLRVSSLCRGGFFSASSGAELLAARDENARAVEETAAMAAAGAPGSEAVLVLVTGGLPEGSRDLAGAREHVRDEIGELVGVAAAAGVKLAIEPLHPMFAADRAVVSTLGQALDIAEQFDTTVGVVVDTYHVWWDPELFTQVARAGRGNRIFSYQLADWVTPLPADVLLGRGLPGDGSIDFEPISLAVEQAGYRGDIEVEVFNADYWNSDPFVVARQTAAAVGELSIERSHRSR